MSGDKYKRLIRGWISLGDAPGDAVTRDDELYVDVYRVLEAFDVKSHAVGHAIKKLLCAGQRGKGDYKQDLSEAIDAIKMAIEFAP